MANFHYFGVSMLFIQILTSEVKKLNPYYQLEQQEFEFKDVNFSQNEQFTYGIWSKYNPLSIISQVGSLGLFDSNCFHLHNIMGKSSQSLNLIYYDCLDQSTQSIKKILEFINEDDDVFKFEINIEVLQYENTWYFLEIIEWPTLFKLEILIFQEATIKMYEIKEMQRPFRDTNVVLRFGGDLIVTSSKLPNLQTDTKFSYFPGFIMIQKLSKQTLQVDADLTSVVQTTYNYYGQCICNSNNNYQFSDSQLNQLDKQIYISKNTNCDSFILSGWLKIKDIIQSTDEFTYQLIMFTANFKNSFSNQNLSPFQMSYQISSEGNKILFTTYSYTFPIVTIDFLDDPFIIKKQFIITNSITIWHNIFVNLQDNILKVIIKFYEGDAVYEYNDQIHVKQFNCIQPKLQYGNIHQSTMNYLNVDIRNLVFLNCNESFEQQNCHFSCKDCDGPTMYDCLSCSIESQRIYISEQKVCVCPYNSIDEQTCQTYVNSEFQLIEGKQFINLCQYGYFEYQEDCFKCPSIIRKNMLNCLECLNYPKQWYKDPLCVYDLYFDNDGDTQQLIYNPTQYFFLDGIEVTLCQFCYETQFTSLEDQYLDYQYQNLVFKSFCQGYSLRDFQCYKCEVPFCSICYLSIQGHQCFKCYYDRELINGECISLREIDPKYICRSPSYITSKNKCSICPIDNCKYCFEFQTNDLSKSTLYKDFEQFDEGESFEIGCALCDDNFIFNFNSGRCIYQKPKILNCLRSFINQNDQEVCTLSEIDDFTIAPEIANCQKYLPYCLQCLLSPESTLKCIICQEGYTSSIINGDCYKNELQDSKIVIEGDIQLRDGWVQRVQSFMMQFLPNKYFYPKSEITSYISQIIVECHQGYRVAGSSVCERFCESTCLSCLKNVDGFYCARCPLNYFQLPIRDQENGECSECPQLCQICQSRSTEEIYIIQPSFILDASNQIYTKKCLKPVNNPNIIYDSYLQSTRYCLESNCLNQLKYEVKFTYCGGIQVFWPFGFDYGLNINYCNQMGIDRITIIFQFQIQSQFCGIRYGLAASTLLKSKIFSLRKTYFQLTSVGTLMISPLYSVEISNFDQIELNHVSFSFTQQGIFNIQNNNSKVDLNLIDFAFKLCNLTNILSQFSNEIFGNIIAHNFSLIDSTIINSSIFNLDVFKQNGIITIKTLLIQKCILKDTNLFQFGNSNFNIFISDLIIDQCDFQNSSLFVFYDYLRDLKSLTIYNLTIQSSIFNQSYLIKNANLVQLNLTNLQIIKNSIFSSDLISFNYHLILQTFYIYQNYFVESQLLKQLQTVNSYEIKIKIDSLLLKLNQFKNSDLFFIYSSQLNNVYLDLSFIHLEENSKQSSMNDQNVLFIIQCNHLHIQNVTVINVNDFIIFKIYESFSILIENIFYENRIQTNKIPLSPDCQSQMNWKNQLFGIIGFFSLQMFNIQVIKQFNVDSSIIDISSSNGYSKMLQGIISIQDLIFKENVQIQNEYYNLMSLLTIHAENELRIHLGNINFIENIVHSQVESNLKQAASLMFIISQASSLEITNINSYNNAFTNSTNSFINIICNKLLMINFTTTNLNMLTQKLWRQYYDIQLEDHLNQEELNSLIIKILNIQNIGGACSITSSELFCLNCSFTNILAQKSSIFQINTINNGFIKLDQLKVFSVQHKLQFITNSSGCISINSQNSLLNLEITNAIFSNVMNRMAPSIFTIIPSQIQNQISLQNTQILNCISLINQVFYLQFSPQNIKNNLFILQNLTIIQNEEKWINYFSKILSLSETEMTEIAGLNNAVIYIENCQTVIKELSIYGLYISTLMRFNNVIKFHLFNSYLQDIQLFYPCNIIAIDQDVDIKMMISFQQVYIQRIQVFKTNLVIEKLKYNNYQIKDCKLFQAPLKNNQTSLEIPSIQSRLHRLSQKSVSMIQISSICIDNQITFNKIKIQDNECSFCNEGLIYFKIDNINYLKIYEIQCISNSILSYGCIVFYQQDLIDFKAQIINSIFYDNRGSIGVGIAAYNQSLIIKSCKILKNQASAKGGGLYLGLNNNTILFNQSIILNNYAEEGGGIYINGDYNLNNSNFVQTLLLYNKAQLFTDNLIENPTHLALIINQKEMHSKNKEDNISQKYTLIIDPYLIIEQEKLYYANYLMLPSGQEIKSYEIVLPKSSQTLLYIYEIELVFKNSRNEQLFNLFNSTCQLNSFIQQKDGQIQEINHIATLDFNIQRNNFDLSLISIVFDPYEQNNEHLHIDAVCKTGQSNKTLVYSLNIKSFKCQLGEFYTQQGCQQCIASQGFYSVTYDTIKCSIFDKTKFQEITQNKINLLEGFWRPDYLSDYTSSCFKNKNFCIGGWSYGNNLCSVGHIGALCEECDIQNIMGQGKYYKDQQNLECQKCQKQANNFASFVFTLIWAICSILLTLKSIEKSNLMFSQLKSTERFNKILFKLNQDHQSILIKMLLNYLWIFSLIFTFNLQFSISFFFIDQASNTSYFMVNNLDCYLANLQTIELIYSKIFTMLIFILIQFLFVIAGFIMYLMQINQKYNSSIISNTLLSLYIFNYAGLIKMLCSIISNRWISNVNYIQGDVSLKYGNQTHLMWMFYFVIPTVVLFGCLAPFSLFIIMYCKKKYLDQIKLRRHLCYLFNEYNETSYFWEQIKLVQKFVMILISTYFETEISMKASLFGISLLCYQFLTVKYKPYLTSQLNHLDLKTGQICSMSIFLAAVKYISEQNNNFILSIILQTMIFILCVKLCQPFIWSIAQINYKKNKVPFLILIQNLFQKLRLKRCLKCMSEFIIKEKERELKLKANYLKLKIHLFSTSKALMTNRKTLLTQGNTSSINYGKKFRISENFMTNQFFTLETN